MRLRTDVEGTARQRSFGATRISAFQRPHDRIRPSTPAFQGKKTAVFCEPCLSGYVVRKDDGYACRLRLYRNERKPLEKGGHDKDVRHGKIFLDVSAFGHEEHPFGEPERGYLFFQSLSFGTGPDNEKVCVPGPARDEGKGLDGKTRVLLFFQSAHKTYHPTLRQGEFLSCRSAVFVIELESREIHGIVDEFCAGGVFLSVKPVYGKFAAPRKMSGEQL